MTGGWDRGTIPERFRSHMGRADHLYGHAIRAMADDWETGGPVRAICAGYEDAPDDSVIQLRLLAGVFRLVLTGRADGLRPYYRCLGGTAAPEDFWPALRPVLAAHVEELHAALAVAPQTNEVGRSASLLAGLFSLVAQTGERKVRLLELGSSAGLNLLLDRFTFTGGGWSWGRPDSRLLLADAIEGPVVPVDFEIVERRGCDLHPIDPTSPEGRLRLTSFVWPFDVHRHERLAAALDLAAVDPAPVDRAGAGAWLADQLPQRRDGLTVVWYSITRQYWSAAERAAVDELLANFPEVAVVSLEFDHTVVEARSPALRVTPPGGPTRVIGLAHHHGVPVRLGAPS